MSTKRKYYITGGAGFIGRHFNEVLDQSEVINVDLRQTELVPNQVTGNINDIDFIRSTIGDSDIILHLAASHYDFEKDYFTTNVGATEKLLKVAGEKEIKEIVFYSSVAVYGVHHNPADEQSEPAPENDYGRSKLEAEQVIRRWVDEEKGRKALIIRPAVVFGPHNYGNIFNLMRNIDRGVNVQIGSKPAIKSIAYVKNLVNATFYLMKHTESAFEVFNYADTPHLSNFEISNAISSGLDKKGVIKLPYFVAYSLGGFFDLIGRALDKEMVISVKRVKKFCTPTFFEAEKIKEFGFEPSYNTYEGLIETGKWFKKNRNIWESEYANLKKLLEKNYGISIE